MVPWSLLFGLTTLLTLHIALAQVAPSPAPSQNNLTSILTKGGQYVILLRLLRDTQVGSQIQSQLNNSFNGLTMFAPTDNAFNNLKPGTLNGLTNQEQVELVLAHVLPRFYSLENFQTASNPLQTQGSSSAGSDTLNVTSANNQLNVSTGVVEARVDNPLYSTFPLAIYPVDKVLLPYNLFGAKPPASAPTPVGPAAEKPGTTPAVAGGPAADSGSKKGDGTRVRWSLGLGVGLLVVAVGNLL